MDRKITEVIEEHIVPTGVENQRLSEYTRGIFESFPSRKSVKKAIKRNQLLVNGETSETGHWVKTGEKLSVVKNDQKRSVFDHKLEVLFEDEEIAAVHKPGDIAVSGNQFRTVANALSFNLSHSSQKDAFQHPQPVHRLDRQTSGILLVAKTRKAAISLGRQFENRTVKKVYRAIVTGKIFSGKILNSPIDGKEARTEILPIRNIQSKKFGGLTELQAKPLTGRTNQIRIHLAEYKTPILGDTKYGGEKSGRGLFLFAEAISFNHPVDNREVNIQLELPKKFRKI